MQSAAREPGFEVHPTRAELPRPRLVPASATSVSTSTAADGYAALLDLAGPVAGLHVLLIGCDALEAMCRLNGQGALSVVTIRAGRCMPTGPADLAIAPNLAAAHSADMAILQARLSLRLLGRLLLHFAPDDTGAVLRHAEARLLDNGFVLAPRQADPQTVIAAWRQDL